MTDFELAKEYFFNGCALLEAEEFSQAEGMFIHSLELMPDRASTLTNLSATQLKLKKYSEAKVTAEKAILVESGNSEVYLNLGLIEKELQRFESAITFFDKAISLKPNYAEGFSNKGVTLHELRRDEEAITQYDKAISLKPYYHEAWSNKGVTLRALKRNDEAIVHFDKAISLKPSYAEAWSNKGNLLNELKRYDEAIVHYEKALSFKPDIDWILGDLLHSKMKIAHWTGLADSLDMISNKVMASQKVINPFVLLSISDDALLQKKCSEIYAQDKYPLNLILGAISKSAKKEKIRIAYFSPDFQNHPVSLLTAELFDIHDRNRFEVYGFSLQNVPIGDKMNLRLRKSFDRFIDVEKMSDREIAQLARELQIDIAIDLAGPTQNSRTGIFSYRAAPIQVNWLGYAGTIGTDSIDYIVADKTMIPESHQQMYVEKVAYLPNTFMVDDSERIASSRIFTRQQCGLPENVFVFCCFNNDHKFNPQVLDSWSRILLAVNDSVLWISENNQRFTINIKTEFEKRGIDSKRIIFAQRVELMSDHLARYPVADLFLDTHPYNAHTTSVDSLKAGVPVLTLQGQSFASRVAASLLNAIDLPELITNTQEEYEALAIVLAKHPQKLANIKSKLAKNRFTTPLFDTTLFAKNLEAAYIKMYERYQADLPPDHISIV